MIDESILKIIIAIAQQAGATAIAVIVVGWILIKTFVEKHEAKVKAATEKQAKEQALIDDARAAKLLEYERKRDDQFKNVDNALRLITSELHQSMSNLARDVNNVGQRVATIEGRLHGSISIVERA